MRLFLDVTRLRQRSRRSTPSGIDRVEFAYLDHALSRLDPGNVEFVASRGFGEGLITRDRAGALREQVQAAWRLGQVETHDGAFAALRAALSRPIDRSTRACLRIGAAAAEWRVGGLKNARDALRARTRLARRLDGHEAVYLHTSHTHLDKPSLTRWLDGAPLRAVFFLHDVIPLETPEFCRPGEHDRHLARLGTIVRHAALVLVNSQATADAASAQIERAGWRAPRFAVAPLGVEDCFRSPRALTPMGATHPYFVVVGTIEPRKNLAFLLAAWRRLSERHGAKTPRLVVVGRRGWENESVIDYFERSHAVAPFVIEASDLGDAGLACVMADAQAVLAPSMSEGFNLPIAEALTLGRAVVASDIPAHREVGQGLARLLDPLDGPGWARAVEAACGLSDEAPPPSPGRAYRALTWREHVDCALGHIEAHFASAPAMTSPVTPP